MSVAFATGYTSVRDAAGELSERSPGLFAVTAINFCLFAVMVAIAPFDGRSVLGLNPWIKPMKFALSIAIYTATVGWFIQYLRLEQRTKQWITWGIGGAMLVEIAVITFQGARAVPSHFNFSTVFDVALNGIMVTMILLNTVLVAYLLVRFWRTDPSLAPAYLWGVRLGFLVFFLASLEGFAMIGQGTHTVGAPDGGPGLPFVNWSTTAGDLRIAHFVGMHSFQTIPLVGYVLAGVADRGWLTHSVALVWAYAISHASVALAVFVVALTGQPLLSL